MILRSARQAGAVRIAVPAFIFPYGQGCRIRGGSAPLLSWNRFARRTARGLRNEKCAGRRPPRVERGASTFCAFSSSGTSAPGSSAFLRRFQRSEHVLRFLKLGNVSAGIVRISAPVSVVRMDVFFPFRQEPGWIEVEKNGKMKSFFCFFVVHNEGETTFFQKKRKNGLAFFPLMGYNIISF